MNGEDPFENRLRRVQQRPVPPAWRQDILSAARAAARVRNPGLAPSAWLQARLKEMFWPHPAAWAGLAAVWFLMLVLNFAAEAPRPEFASQAGTRSPQERRLLREQQELFAELVGPNTARQPGHQRPDAHQPRGEHLENAANA